MNDDLKPERNIDLQNEIMIKLKISQFELKVETKTDQDNMKSVFTNSYYTHKTRNLQRECK